MRKSFFIFGPLILFVIVLTAKLIFFNHNEQQSIHSKPDTIHKGMKIKSSVFANQEKIPAKYTCTGEDVSPPLHFEEVPSAAKSLVLIVDDPDAPSPSAWVHWVVYNIDPTVTENLENSVPQGGQQGTSSFGKSEYGGPCPPSGTHRYFFKLYALDMKLDLPSADKQVLEEKMQGHILDQAELIGLYSK